MIENVPDAVELEQTAVRLYFTAWEHVMEVILPILHVASLSITVKDRKLTPIGYQSDHYEISEEQARDELERYVSGAQPDLHLCYALIQQSQEIALKARICAVSPFLLLLGSDVKSWAKPNADFTDFRTLDAVDLVRVVNAVCPEGVSEQFATKFDIVRRGRNKIQHLGSFRDAIDPLAALDILVDQWTELFPGKNWLKEYHEVMRRSQFGAIAAEDFGEEWALINKVDELTTLVTDKQRRRLLGFSPDAEVFRCWECFTTSKHDDQGGDYCTASMEQGSSKIVCRMCSVELVTRTADCVSGCGCNIIIAEGDCINYCADCGQDQLEEKPDY